MDLPLCETCRAGTGPLCDGCARTHCGSGNTASHEQAHLARIGRCVDRAVAAVVDALNRCGWVTEDSCAGTPGIGLGRPYVGFAVAQSAVEVAEAVLLSHPGDTDLEDRVLASMFCPLTERWDISLALHGLPGSLHPHPYLTLPAKDLTTIVSACCSADGSVPQVRDPRYG